MRNETGKKRQGMARDIHKGQNGDGNEKAMTKEDNPKL
jgi:hypothetical protein